MRPQIDENRILFHGHGLVAIDKPPGVPVHAGTGHDRGVTELLNEWNTENPGFLDLRHGNTIHPVHRLDLEASGALLLALKKSVARHAKSAFSERTVGKRYLAVVAGPVDAEGRMKGTTRTRLRGRYQHTKAELQYRRLRHDERMSLVEVVPEGGKTHQIRAVFAENDRPLAGDLRYGKPKPARQFLEKFGMPFLLLHCWRLDIPKSVIGHDLRLEATIPEDLHRLCDEKGWPRLAQDGGGEWVVTT